MNSATTEASHLPGSIQAWEGRTIGPHDVTSQIRLDAAESFASKKV
jgi:hypothetical protein